MTPPVYGHDEIFERFRRAVAQGRLATTFLFVGMNGIGKRAFAEQLAAHLLCERNAPGQLERCGECESCRLTQAGNHPDLIVVEKLSGRTMLVEDQFREEGKSWDEKGFCPKLAAKSMRGGRKIGIIDDADLLNNTCANLLLKTLEEPPPGSILILIGTSLQRQLPTIRSRCQVVRFQPLSSDLVARILQEQQIIDSPEVAADWAARGGGSVAQAMLYSEESLLEFRRWFLGVLSQGHLLAAPLASTIANFATPKKGGTDDDDDHRDGDDEGEERASAARGSSKKKTAVANHVDPLEALKKSLKPRDRLRFVVQTAMEFYYELLLKMVGAESRCDDPLVHQLVAQRTRSWGGSIDHLFACLSRCLVARQQVDANTNIATMVEAWIDDLEQLEWRRG
ncbi:MAG: DNA polymerase III subunit [Planctomycetota bacterium]